MIDKQQRRDPETRYVPALKRPAIGWHRIVLGAVLLASVFGHAAMVGDAAAETHPSRISQTHKGIRLIAEPLKPGAEYDVKITGQRHGLDNLRRALDMLLRRSPLNAAAIATLKETGSITIVYNPNFPKRTVGEFTVAAFSRKAFQRSVRARRRRMFLVIVGRHGIQWPIRELAAILAHELAGHGLQHLRGDARTMRQLDRECEAHLYEEKAFQDLGVDKKSRLVVQFRKQLENHACVDFKRYMAEHTPDAFRTWDALHPDIGRLLAIFKDYMIDRREQGVPPGRERKP